MARKNKSGASKLRTLRQPKKTPNKLGLKRAGGRSVAELLRAKQPPKKLAVRFSKKSLQRPQPPAGSDEDEDEEGEGEGEAAAAAAAAAAAVQTTPQKTYELKFGRNLVHPDKKIRDRTIKTLSGLLSKRPLPEFEHERLWKAMFYCMWLSDKVPVQQELANNLAGLLHAPTKLNGLPYLRAFWVTIAREWANIDYLRMDKFYSLMRHFIRHTFQWLQAREWSLTAVQLYATLLSLTVLNPEDRDTSKSIANHIADVYWEELLKVLPADATLSPEVTAGLLQPFLHLVSLTTQEPTVNRIVENILQPLLDSSAPMDVRYDDEEATPEGKIADHLDVDDVPTLLHSYATSRFTSDKFRPKLYKLQKDFAALVAAKAPAKKPKKGRADPAPAAAAPVPAPAPAPAPTKAGKKAPPAAANGGKRPVEEVEEPAPQPQPTPKKQARTSAPTTPVAAAPSTPATPPSGEYVTAPSTPVTPPQPAKAPTTPKTILRSRASSPSKSGKAAGTPASQKKSVRIDLSSNKIRPFEKHLPPTAISSPMSFAGPDFAAAAPGTPQSAGKAAKGLKKKAADFF